MLARRWSARSAALGLPLTLTLVATLGWACSSSNDGASGGAGGTSSSSGGTDSTVSTSDCTAGCQQKATACQAPTAIASQQCSSICGGGVTQSQLACLSTTSCEDLERISDSASLESVCPKGAGGTSSGTSGTISSPGKFGAKCKCEADSTQGAGEFECKGTNICSEGLSCVGSRTQGVDDGTCRGPRCCSGAADCAAKLGKQSNCASGQKCTCTRGDLECVGDKCTCANGVAGSVGLCYPAN